MLPFFEVSHLPSSTSFFSDILQPLGLVYIFSEQASEPPVASNASTLGPNQPLKSVTYGTLSTSLPILQLREVAQPKRSHAVCSAPSPTAVLECHRRARRANPASPGPLLDGFPAVMTGAGGERSCRIADLDGNIMEIISRTPTTAASRRIAPTPSSHEMQAMHDPANYILSWKYDTAALSEQMSPTIEEPKPCTVLRRSVTTSTIEQPSRDSAADHGSSAATTIIGALLGAAAGAALTYGVMKSETTRTTRCEAAPPPISRRTTFPVEGVHTTGDPYTGHHQYIRAGMSVEKPRYPQEYAPIIDHWAPRHYLEGDGQESAARSRAMGGMGDGLRSHRPSHTITQGDRGSDAHSTVSEEPRPPLMLMEHEHRSMAGSRHSSVRPPSALARSYDLTDKDTYVSTRSHRSTSTIKGPPPPTVETELATRSRASSRAPSVRAPSVRAPSVRAPSVRAPSVRAPSVRAPSVKAPSTIAPSFRAPSVRAPSVRAPSTIVPGVRAPSVVAPSVMVPCVKEHSLVDSRPSAGDQENGGMVSRAGSRTGAASQGPDYLSSGDPGKASRASSRVSARHIGLPMSGVGSSHAGWGDDDVSVAPSDSISCVGSKGTRRFGP